MDIKKYCSMKMHGTKLVKKITRNRLPLEKSKKKNKERKNIYHISYYQNIIFLSLVKLF